MKQKYHVLWAAAVVLALSGCGSAAPTSESRLRLGTSITITIHERVPRGTFAAIWNRLEEIEGKMSINQARWDSTELMQVNRAAGEHPVNVSDETLRVLKTGLEIGRLSDGAFDVTVAPLVLLWMVTGDQPVVPGESEIEQALRLIDYTRVEIQGSTVFLPKEGMGIDLGGVAKGYAVEETVRLLREAGIEHAILDFGGDIFAMGTRRDGDDWRIGLQNPDQRRGTLMGLVEVVDTAIVTSGVYERYFEQDGTRYHHIIDTETGYPAWNELTSVTIVSQDATVADALSTAAFVMGLEDGMALIEDMQGIEGVFIDNRNRVHITSGLGEKFRLLSDEFSLAGCQRENSR